MDRNLKHESLLDRIDYVREQDAIKLNESALSQPTSPFRNFANSTQNSWANTPAFAPYETEKVETREP